METNPLLVGNFPTGGISSIFFSDFLFERSFLVTQGVDELTPTYFLDSLMVFQDGFVSILENPPKASLLDPNRFD